MPTKVGYILTCTSGSALQLKYELKSRSLSKPAVVLTDDQSIFQLAKIPKRYQDIIQRIRESRILCGFILHRDEDHFTAQDQFARLHSKNIDGTTCFVINHGYYSEYLAQRFFAKKKILLASSANLSGRGNNGRFDCIGQQITTAVAGSISDDPYVALRYEPGSGEQGVMINLLGDQPEIIRRGVDFELLKSLLEDVVGPDGYLCNHGNYP